MEYLVEMVAVGVGDEYLTETIARNQLHDRFNSLGIKFVEYIVKQEQWRGVGTGALQETELRQLQGNDECLVLSLATLTLHRIVAKRKLQVVAMHTMQRIAHGTVLESISLDYLDRKSVV